MTGAGLAILGLGLVHGINPGMGWLFAVGLGLQERDRRAVWRALLPLALGHAMDGQGIEELVGEDDALDRSGMERPASGQVDGLPLDETAELGVVALETGPHRVLEGPATSAPLTDGEQGRPVQVLPPDTRQVAPEATPEERVQLRRGQEIALSARTEGARGVVAQPRLGEGAFHEPGEGEAAIGSREDLLTQALDEDRLG